MKGRKKENLLQRMIAILLSVLLVFGTVSEIVPAAAVNLPVEIQNVMEEMTQFMESHTHDDYKKLGTSTWINQDGMYYLEEDMVMSSYLTIGQGIPEPTITADVTLCLNGHSISGRIWVGKGSKLRLCDCAGGGTVTYNPPSASVNKSVIHNYGTLEIFGGTIKNEGDGDAVMNYGSCTINGGTLESASGCALNVWVNADCTINGGTFQANCNYGCIVNNGNLTIHGGTIHNNVAMAVGNNSILYIDGGEMEGADYGLQLKSTAYLSGSHATIMGGKASINLKGSELLFANYEGDSYIGDVLTVDATSIANDAIIIQGVDAANQDLFIVPADSTYSFWIDGTSIKKHMTHLYDNSNDMICNICGYDRTMLDKQPPTGTIKVGKDAWTDFRNTITFERFFNESTQIMIEGKDIGSGIDGIYYYVSDNALSEKELKELSENIWVLGTSFSITALDRKCVVYARIVDKAGNVTYLSSDGLVFDGTAPAITGVEDGKTYRTSQTVVVTDQNLESVRVNGTKVNLNDGKFTLTATDGEQTILAVDYAGNKATVTTVIKTESENIRDARKIVEETLEEFEAGNDTTKESIQNAIELALRDADITVVTVRIGELIRTEATIEEKGSISGNILLVCGNSSDEIVINKTIERLLHTHSFGNWEIIKPASEKEDGLQERSCTVCGYKEGESIPKTGDGSSLDDENNPGEIGKDVETGVNAPATSLALSADELADILLTEEDKEQLNNGTDIKLVLEVEDASGSVSSTNQALVEAALHDYTIGQYLDISLFKIIGEDRSAISETNKKLTITIIIPEALKNVNSNAERDFAVVRVHNNVAEILNDLDTDKDTITIETDRFSTYAIIYKDVENGTNDKNGADDTAQDNNNNDNNNNSNNGADSDNNDNSNNNDADNNNSNANTSASDASGTNSTQSKDDEPRTGENAPLEIYATAAMIAGLSYLLSYFKEGKCGMTEENKNEMVSGLIRWAKAGGWMRRLLALAVIFMLLLYYHSIGKKTVVEWKEVYGE